MRNSSVQPRSVVPPMVMLLPLGLVVAAFTVATVYVQQSFVPLSTGGFMATVFGIGIAAALLFGPSRLILTTVFIYALLGHQFRSFVVIPWAGVEWHPREVVLLLLFAHGLIKMWQRRFVIHWTPLHLCMLLYSAFFIYAAWRGLWLGNAPRTIIAELRAPLFLGAFWVFAGCIRTPRDLHYYGNLALCLITLLALATVAFFVYASLTGPWPNTQNALGEFVPRTVLGTTLQSVRPSGHAWFEGGLVLCVGMFLCPREPWYRRIIYVGLGSIFSLAIVVGMMRTALVSVMVSLLVLGWLNLPRVGKGLAAGLFVGVIPVVVGLLFARGTFPTLMLGDASLTARYVEYAGALHAMKEYPFFGAGLGASFEALGLAAKTSGGSAIPVNYDSLHNVWLYFAWKGGLVGLVLVVLALSGLLLYCNRITTRLPTMNQRCFARALQAIFVGQLVASSAMPRLTYANGALFLVIWTMAFVLLERIQTPHMLRTTPEESKADGDFFEEEPEATPAPKASQNVSPTLEPL